MQPIELPNRPTGLTPKNALLEYEYEGIKARVILTLDDTLKDNHLMISAQAYEMNEDGTFVQAPNGYPSRTPSSVHTVNSTSLGTKQVPKQATLAPGWVLTLPPNQTSVNADNLPEGCVAVETLPETASVGDTVYKDPYMYRWDEGIAVATAKSKVEELFNIIANSQPLSGLGFGF